jgi:tetratricopeptide repeat protein 21B
VRVAEKLLRELTRRPKSLQHYVLECYALMATQQKPNVELSVQRLMDLLNSERDHVPALLALATALMMLKQTPKARNQLKRIAKMDFQQQHCDQFERSWLMLADIYIAASKFDLAQELCKRCLVHNKSCAKAWEHMGFIMEKEAAYKDAAEHYERAWALSSHASARVGYRLAFNYLKAKRHVEAINVCHKVLAQFPDYPKIKREVMDKARAALRP